jgi:DNA ligase-4
MSDIDEDQDSNVHSALLSRADLLDAEYPERPKNTQSSLKFRDLVCSLFEAMVDLQHKPRTRKGPQFSAHEARRNVINRFIQRWRKEVGPDIYPAFRLIMPDRDKDRPMYGLKEASLGKMLVTVSSAQLSSLIYQDNGHRQGFRRRFGNHEMETSGAGNRTTQAF